MNLIRRRPPRRTTGAPDASAFAEGSSSVLGDTGSRPATLAQSVLARSEEAKAAVRRAAVSVLVAAVVRELSETFSRKRTKSNSGGELDVSMDEPLGSSPKDAGTDTYSVSASPVGPATMHFSHPLPATHAMLGMLKDRCGDKAGSVRKAAIHGMVEVVRVVKEGGGELEWGWIWKTWKASLFPTAFDPDNAIQEEMADIVIAEVVEGVLQRPSIMSPLLFSLDRTSTLALRHMCTILVRKGGITKSWIQNIGRVAQDLIGRKSASDAITKDKGKGKGKARKTDSIPRANAIRGTDINAEGVWRLYRELSTASPAFADVPMVLTSWENIENEVLGDDLKGRILEHMIEVLGAAGFKGISASEDPRKLRASVIDKLGMMLIPVRAIASAVNLVVQLTEGKAAKVNEADSTWKLLLDRAEGQLDLKKIVENPQHVDSEAILRAIVMGICVAQLAPNALPTKFVASLQSILATTSKEVIGLKAQALIGLGKLAAQNDDLAKIILPVVARELETSLDFTMRNNAAIVLCDLARYSKSDRYVHILGNTLADESELVRRQVLQGLTRLLQEEYIKLSPDLFLKIVSRVADPVPEVRSVAEYCLLEVLLPKQPGCLYSHFVDNVAFLNNDTDSRAVKIWVRGEMEVRFTLPGDGENEIKRRSIFKFMLSNFTDVQRLELRQKICTDVIGNVLGGQIDITTQGGRGQLQDALWALCCQVSHHITLHEDFHD
ncbi:hypothetical protein M427DRAFT_210558 [Gonapodya prolifera JEL478]|uniref:Condensin complex subunit 1 C-terminal domain-containing protein n=1 Tax=Gonapodya prolifera (strain JEL478) TaxID=1344416 RepID=A0A139AP71_GONPJ|nr:hypothetical protein M427DRAFT_210558 [Gonapodya prolifera JEL478]|eukprot:KXS18444.1 hypothetical protein M427DRAFT_210558 [Gonapodya prolifera JEL478]